MQVHLPRRTCIVWRAGGDSWFGGVGFQGPGRGVNGAGALRLPGLHLLTNQHHRVFHYFTTLTMTLSSSVDVRGPCLTLWVGGGMLLWSHPTSCSLGPKPLLP